MSPKNNATASWPGRRYREREWGEGVAQLGWQIGSDTEAQLEGAHMRWRRCDTKESFGDKG